MAEPTAYDEIQDGRLDSLESLTSAEYQPPSGTEYSYPVANQGITQEQFRTMMRAAGKGTFVQHDEDGAQISYKLIGHDSDTETNQRNTLILRPSSHTGKAETVSNGFFHVLTEDMELPFPAVTTATTYHVTITYDPRLFITTPLKIEVYPGEPPTSQGRDHVVLWTVHRAPNQLLSQATLTQKAGWVSSVITVFAYHQLPEPYDVDYGTLAVNIGGESGPELYSSRGVHGWVLLASREIFAPGPWKTCGLYHGWEDYTEFGRVQARNNQGVVEMRGTMQGGAFNNDRTVVQLPTGCRPTGTRMLDPHFRDKGFDLRAYSHGGLQWTGSYNTNASWVSFEGVSFAI